jgi:hypothetical protein
MLTHFGIIELLLIFIFLLPLLAFQIITRWIVYKKAGKPGWASIVPIYNYIVLLEIVGKPWWWIFLYLIPIVNIVYMIWTLNLLSKSFGKDEGFTIGLVLLSIIFFAILAFGNAVYQGPAGINSNTTN